MTTDKAQNVPNTTTAFHQPPRPVARNGTTENGPLPPQTPNQNGPRTAPYQNRPNPPHQQRPYANQAAPLAPGPLTFKDAPGHNLAGPQNNGAAEPVAFFSARAVNQLPDAGLQGAATGALPVPQGQQAFNPKAESPSIRKTPGIDHTSSKPVARNGQHTAPAGNQQSGGVSGPTGGFTPVGANRPPLGAGRGNVVNPQFDHSRRIGAPGAAGSPMANRASYRPPTMKRPVPNEGTASGAPGRPALAEVPVNGLVATGPSGTGPDAKKQKLA
jgi:DNA repair and recombination protein RAD52